MKLNQLSLAVCVCILLVGSVSAQQPAPSPVHMLDGAGKISATTVTALDARNHIVTLKGPQGNELGLRVGGAAKLGAIQVGDTVVATYVHSVARNFQEAMASAWRPKP